MYNSCISIMFCLLRSCSHIFITCMQEAKAYVCMSTSYDSEAGPQRSLSYARMSCTKTRNHARRTCCTTRTRTPAHRHACSFLARKYKILSPVI